MVATLTKKPTSLYLRDETAWLEATADLITSDRLDEIDYQNLAEYLTDMARRDRREVDSRLALLLVHLLKWDHQPEKRTGNWRATIVVQRQELAKLIGRGVLRIHAEDVLADAYRDAVEQAVAETGLPAETFPMECPYGLVELVEGKV